MTADTVTHPQQTLLTLSHPQTLKHLELELFILLRCFARRLLLLLLLPLLLHQQINNKIQLFVYQPHKHMNVQVRYRAGELPVCMSDKSDTLLTEQVKKHNASTFLRSI